jgi:3-phenylpropionate/trans-cinnamate dioxygenase ferredoxin subunit
MPLHRVAALQDVRPGRGIAVTPAGTDVTIALIRHNGTCHAVSNVCPHEHTPSIADGHVEDGWVDCPIHGWRFSLETGKTPMGAPGLRVYSVSVVNGEVFVEIPDDGPARWML